MGSSMEGVIIEQLMRMLQVEPESILFLGHPYGGGA